MKRIPPILMLVLTGLELQAQINTNGLYRTVPRYGLTNGMPAVPRYPTGVGPQGRGPAGGLNPFPGRPGNPAGAGGLNPNAFPGTPPAVPAAGTYGQPGAGRAAAAAGTSDEEMIPPGLIDFEGVELNEVLKIYAKLVNRTLLRGALPQTQIILNTQTPLTKTEAIQALQAVLALNGVSVIDIGDKFVKVLPSDQANSAGQVIDTSTNSADIPTLGSYVTRVVQLKYVKPKDMVQVITPFAKLNSIIPLDDNGILVIRDYAENVKRMLDMINLVDVSVPAEYVSEVIGIKYAKVDDIASVLNALGGGGGVAVSIGTAPGSGQISGLSGRGGGGFGGQGGISSPGGGIGSGIGGSNPYQSGGVGGSSTFGGRTTPNGTPSGGSTFQQRLNSIIGATSPGGTGGGAGGGKDQIQLFGQTKIIPNESSSSLLVYATRQDMEVIKGIIAKLDVPLPQVLIEAAVVDYSLGPNTFNFGFSAAQNPAQNGNVIGGGGMNNGSNPFMQFIQNLSYVTNFNANGSVSSISTISSIASAAGTNAAFGNNLPGGASYFANIGPNWDVALTAAASDSHASVIQRPRILASQAKPAQFFVGDTVPYVTSSYGGGYGGVGYGNSYSQLSVGVELDVTPFINPEGMVSMDIQQEVDDLNGYTTITGVGQVPNTIKRTLNSSMTVRDRDTVMLGGFIKSNKSTSRSGIPFLMDIPILGNLFVSRSDSKQREELIVLMRPTVLQTPELAAKNTLKEERRLPGAARTVADNDYEERTKVAAERKYEERKNKNDHSYEGVFTTQPNDSDTNSVPQSGTNNVPANPGAGVEDTTPDSPTVPGTSTNGASMNPQQSAAAALAQKMADLNANATNSAH